MKVTKCNHFMYFDLLTKLLYDFLITYQAANFNDWEKVINCMLCFHTQLEVFFQTKFHPGMKFCSLYPWNKFTCKQVFFIPGRSFISVTYKKTLELKRWRETLSRLCEKYISVACFAGSWKEGMFHQQILL